MINPLIPTNNCRSVRWYQQRMLHFGLILLGFLAYSNTFTVPFVLDDFLCVAGNPAVKRFSLIFDLNNFQQHGISEDLRNSLITRCVTYATFALNYKLHEFWLPGFHAFNLLIHLANASLLYLLLQKSSCRTGVAPTLTTKHATMPALLTALLFVAHPIATNAVTYTTQRFALLAAFFSLLALLGYQQAATTPRPNLHWPCYITALTATVLAMYSKEIAFTLPILLATYDFTFLDGTLRTRIRRLAPFLLTMLLLPLTVIKLSTISTVTAENVGNALELANLSHVSRADYAITQVRVVVTYLRLMIWPTAQNIDYDYPVYTSLDQFPILWSGLLLTLLAGSGGYLLLRFRALTSPENNVARWVGFGIIWFFLALAMESSFIPLDDLLFEYRLYFPSIGFLIAAVAAAQSLSLPLLRRSPNFRVLRVLFCTLAILTVIILTIATFSRNQIWKYSVTLWQDTVEKSPRKARSHIGLAGAYFSLGQAAEAAEQVLIARSLPGATWIDHLNLAAQCNTLGMIDESIEEIKIVIASEPQTAYYHGVLGQLYLNRGETSQAIAAFETALRLNPDYREVRSILNDLLSRSGESRDRQ